MALMARMRDLAPAFILSVGVIFILFMVISDSRIMEIFGARSNKLGSVNGEEITYQKFNELVERYAEQQKQQTGQEIDPENMDQFRDQVWDVLVNQLLTEHELKKYGITVTDEEVRESILGDNPPEFLRRQFTDSTGRFNRPAYEQALLDPKNKQIMISVENQMKQQLIAQKLQSMLNVSITVSEEEIHRKFVDQTLKMSAEYILVDAMGFKDDQVAKPTDQELKKFYDEHPERYKQDATRKLKYVIFPLAPSRSDSNMIAKNLNSVLTKIKNSKDTAAFKTFAKNYSEAPYSKDTVDVTSLPKDLTMNPGVLVPGAIVGPASLDATMGIYHILGVTKSDKSLARASHILIPVSTDSVKDLATANKIYDDLQKGADFATLAVKYSKDPGSAANGGDLGWFAQGRMVKEFEDAVFGGQVGVIQKPVKTMFGYHIIKVTSRSAEKYVVEKIVNSLKASSSTREEISQKANDFAFIAEKNGFEAEAKNLNYTIQETGAFTKESPSVPGIGYSHYLTNFAFEKGINAISATSKTQAGYVVAMIAEVTNAGVREFEKVKEDVTANVLREKKFELARQVAEEVKSKLNPADSLKEAVKINAKARYGVAPEFSLAGPVPSLGNDWLFASEASKAPMNSISAPVKGTRGYYIMRVTKRNNLDESQYQAQRGVMRDQLLQEARGQYYQLWVKSLKDKADIVDNRDKYFGR